MENTYYADRDAEFSAEFAKVEFYEDWAAFGADCKEEVEQVAQEDGQE